MRFKNLKIYQDAMVILAETYRITRKLPKEELYNLVSQMNRSALSIPSNIAEGSGKNSDQDFARFISIANGSCSELYCQFEAVIILYPDMKSDADGMLIKIEELSRTIKIFHRTLKK